MKLIALQVTSDFVGFVMTLIDKLQLGTSNNKERDFKTEKNLLLREQ